MKIDLTPALQLPPVEELRTRLTQLGHETEAVKKLLRLAIRFERKSSGQPVVTPTPTRPEVAARG